MSSRVEFESAAEVLSAANSVEATSPSQLKRLRRYGLIPRPRQKSFGKGSVAFYPAGTSKQIIEVLKIKKDENRLAYVAWRLWWEGRYEIDLKPIRALFKKINYQWDNGTEKLIDKETGGLSNIALDWEDRSDVMDLRLKPIARARKRVGTRNFPAVVHVCLELLTGIFERFDLDPKTNSTESTEHTLEKAFNIEEARSGHSKGRMDRKKNFGAWLGPNLEEQLKNLSLLFRDEVRKVDPAKVSNIELETALYEYRDFLCWTKKGSRVIRELFGVKAFGLTSLEFMIDTLGIHLQVVGLRLWIALKSNPLFSDAPRFLRDCKKNIARLVLLQQFLEDLRTELPSIAKEIPPWKIIAALENTERAKSYQVKLEGLYLSNKDLLDHFWQRHPEYVVSDGDFNLSKSALATA